MLHSWTFISHVESASWDDVWARQEYLIAASQSESDASSSTLTIAQWTTDAQQVFSPRLSNTWMKRCRQSHTRSHQAHRPELDNYSNTASGKLSSVQPLASPLEDDWNSTVTTSQHHLHLSPDKPSWILVEMTRVYDSGISQSRKKQLVAFRRRVNRSLRARSVALVTTSCASCDISPNHWRQQSLRRLSRLLPAVGWITATHCFTELQTVN